MVLDGARNAFTLRGLATDPIRHVHVRDTHLTDVENPTNVVQHVEDLTFDVVTVNGQPLLRCRR